MSQLGKLLESQTQESHEERTATMMQYMALSFLKEKDLSAVGEVAENLKLSKSSATQLTERLVKAGYVERVGDLDDRRIVRLKISDKGEHEIINLKNKFMEKMSAVLLKIPESDLKELLRIHIKLIQTLQQDKKESV